MRTLIFRKLLDSLIRHTPRRLTSIEIQILLNTTARAFGVRGKRIWSHSPQRALLEYAEFTTSCMQKPTADPAGLYAAAFRTGSIVRRITGFRASYDIEKLVFYLYRNIGILMSGSLPGEVKVTKCCFSRFYAPEQCELMSCIDSGIIAGIAGGGTLAFTERLTEGCSMCRAYFTRY